MSNNRVVDLFYKSATGPRGKRRLLTPIGLLVFFGFIGILIVLSIQTDRFFNFPRILSKPGNKILSLPFLLAGVSLITWCVTNFRKAKGTPVPFNPPTRIIEEGPYAYSRNPMLTGLFTVIFGIGLWIMSLSLIAIYLPLFILMNYVELKKVEEPELAKRFGDTYIGYMKRTPMFFPWKRKSSDKSP